LRFTPHVYGGDSELRDWGIEGFRDWGIEGFDDIKFRLPEGEG